MEWVGLAAAAGGLLYKVWTLVRAGKEFGEEENLSLATETGLEVRGISGTEPDHLVVGQVEGALELSQVGGVQVGQLGKAVENRSARTRTFKSFACCGGTLSIHYDRDIHSDST